MTALQAEARSGRSPGRHVAEPPLLVPAAPVPGPAADLPAPGRHRRSGPSATGDGLDWPTTPEMELWALRVRIDAACRKGEAREGWVSCRVLRRTLGEVG
jgi:hypothetical protein